MNNACMQIALMKIFNQEHRYVKNVKGRESHGWDFVFVWHMAMLVVAILLLVYTGQNTRETGHPIITALPNKSWKW
jgi:hypothetical protein